MKKYIILILLVCGYSNIIYSQNELSLDKGFLGIDSNSAIAGVDLDGRDTYKMTIDDWLSILKGGNRNPAGNIVTFDDFQNNKERIKAIIKQVSDIERQEIIFRATLLDVKVFPYQSVIFDKGGNLSTISLSSPNFFMRENRELLFDVIKTMLDNIYGTSKVFRDKEMIIYLWEDEIFSLSLMRGNNGEVVLYYSKL